MIQLVFTSVLDVLPRRPNSTPSVLPGLGILWGK